MDIAPQIFTAKVMHKRLSPKVNQFTYGVYYVCLPLSQLHEQDALAINRPAAMSLYEKSYGKRDGSAIETWARGILSEYGLEELIHEMLLVTMPKILGYEFNPVSFWMCFDAEGGLRAVLCEVHNTFGETHSYLCAHDDKRVITTDDWLTAEKLFHVSPFLQREGGYQFRFALRDKKLGIWIDYADADGTQQLLTSLVGVLQPMTRASLRKVFWQHPLVTMKAIFLIHFQALKLVVKGIGYIRKPPQKTKRYSATTNLTKM